MTDVDALASLENIEVWTYTVEEEIIKDMKGLVLSDIHFTSRYPLSVSLPTVMKKVIEIVNLKQITVIFLIGDIVENRSPTAVEDLTAVLNSFEKIGVPVYALGGNHDRLTFKSIKYPSEHQNVHVITAPLLLLEHADPPPGTPPRLFLGHDLLNNVWLNKLQSRQFAQKLKQLYKNVINPEDHLLIGHVHMFTNDVNNRCSSVHQFSYDGRYTGYAVITSQNGFNIEYSNTPDFN